MERYSCSSKHCRVTPCEVLYQSKSNSIAENGQVMVCSPRYIMRVLRPVSCTFPFIISIIKQFDLPVTQSTHLVSPLPQTTSLFTRTLSSPSATMPSNTSHIQQRDQLKQHDDLVVPTDEHVEWQAQNELGSTPDFQSIGVPVRTCAVGTPNSTSENLTTK
jgi:hypothetical protein